MLATAIIAGGVAMFAGCMYLRFKMPWPFKYDQKYRRMPDGSFQDARKTTVTDAALIPHLEEAYKGAKYGRRDISDWNISDDCENAAAKLSLIQSAKLQGPHLPCRSS